MARRRKAWVGALPSSLASIRRAYAEAVTVRTVEPVKTLTSMTPAEVAALEKLYGCPVKR